MTRKSVDTLILDLDNTIFDWFAVWFASFDPVYQETIKVTGQPAAERLYGLRRMRWRGLAKASLQVRLTMTILKERCA